MCDYEAVFWDIGGVILDLDSVGAAHRAFVADLAGTFDLEADTALETWRKTLGAHFRARAGTEFVSAREGYAEAVAAAVGHEVEEPHWLPAFERATAATLEPVAGTVEVIRTLDGRLHQGIVSDIDAWEADRLLSLFGVADHLDAVTTSEGVGRTKPDPAMFETALDVAGVEPDRAVMVGDRLRNDMEGASAVGIHTVAFGVDAGPDHDAIDHRIEHPRDLLAVLGIEAD